MDDAVARAQEVAFGKIHCRTPAVEVHKAVHDFFTEQGYRTGRRNGSFEGFFHGTGPGLGMEIHEAPRMGANSTDVLDAGHVVTVEPGCTTLGWRSAFLKMWRLFRRRASAT